jgi:hypothetical protein
MIDRESRIVLANNVKMLIEGELTNDAFDDLEHVCRSNDEAVAAIWTYCNCLYSSATVFPYRLTGRHAPDNDVRLIVSRCIAFLESDCEYTWSSIPFMVKSNTRRMVLVRICLFSVFLSVLLFIIGRWDWSFVALAFISSQLIVVVGTFARSMMGNMSKKQFVEAQKSSWPFDATHKQPQLSQTETTGSTGREKGAMRLGDEPG